MDFIHAYNTPNYLSDLSVDELDHNSGMEEIFSTSLPEAAKQGLSRIAVITHQKPAAKGLVNKGALLKLGIVLEVFNSMEDAVSWIETQNAKQALKVLE
jgi:hypothetical protein